MTQRDNILLELRELQSSLAEAGSQNVYHVPVGYFDNLAEIVLNRIKALDTTDAAEELSYLSPLLSGISKKLPYEVPAGFFDSLGEKVIGSIDEHTSAAEELEELSPLLSGLKKEMPARTSHSGWPYSVPKGYFEQLNNTADTKEMKPAVKVVTMARKTWFRYAAAAVVLGIIAVGSLMIFNKQTTNGDSEKVVTKMLKKVSTEEINSFVQLTDEAIPGDMAKVDPKTMMKEKNDIQELIKDIPEKEIESFLNDTQAGEPENDEDVLTN